LPVYQITCVIFAWLGKAQVNLALLSPFEKIPPRRSYIKMVKWLKSPSRTKIAEAGLSAGELNATDKVLNQRIAVTELRKTPIVAIS